MVRFKLRVKRCAGRDRRDGVVELAACFGRVPALEAVSLFDRERCGDRRLAVRLDGFAVRYFSVNRAAVAACIPCNSQGDGCAAIVAFAIAVRVDVVGILITGVSTGRARLGALMPHLIVRNPRTVAIRMVGIIVGRRAAAGAGFASAMLRIRILAPCTSGIAVTAILRCGVSAGAAGCRSAVLTGGRIAPRPIAHAVAGIVVVRRAAVSARTGAPVLAGRILLPASITVTMTAGVDGFAFGLTASA